MADDLARPSPMTSSWGLRPRTRAVEVDGSRRHGTFVEVTCADEREECRDLLVAGSPNFASYQELNDRRLPVGLLTPE